MNYWLVKSEPEKYSWEKFNKDGRTFWDGVRNYAARNNLRAMAEGDLVFFKIHSRRISHIGVYLGNNRFAHASSRGVAISSLDDAYYSRYFYRGGRLLSSFKSQADNLPDDNNETN